MNRHVRTAIERGEVVPASRLEDSRARAALYQQSWEADHERIKGLAKLHSRPKPHGTHMIDVGTHTTFFCEVCATPWPCATFRWATGKDFAPLKLTIKEVHG